MDGVVKAKLGEGLVPSARPERLRQLSKERTGQRGARGGADRKLGPRLERETAFGKRDAGIARFVVLNAQFSRRIHLSLKPGSGEQGTGEEFPAHRTAVASCSQQPQQAGNSIRTAHLFAS